MGPSFSTVLAQAAVADGNLAVEVPDAWTQGRTVFGGLQAALALRAMRSVLGSESPLRTLQATFAAPLPAGAVQARAAVLRTGSSASQVEARLGTDDATTAVFSAVFGDDRESSVRRSPSERAFEPGPPAEFAFIAGVMPNFTQFFPARWLHGGTPFSANPLPTAVISVDMIDDAKVATESHVLALADFPPPVALSMLSKPANGGTTAWMIEFLDDHACLPLHGWRLDTELVAASAGYTSQTVMVWGPGGEAVALSRQSMVVFA